VTTKKKRYNDKSTTTTSASSFSLFFLSFFLACLLACARIYNFHFVFGFDELQKERCGGGVGNLVSDFLLNF